MTNKNVRLLFVPFCSDKMSEEFPEGEYTIMRLQKALELWRTGEYDLIIVSGGGGFKVPGSQFMKNWFLRQTEGPQEDDILVEDNSANSIQNAASSQKVIEDYLSKATPINQGPREVNASMTIVSELFHCKRFFITFRLVHGWKRSNLHRVPVKYKLTSIGYMKEVIFISAHLLDAIGFNILSKIHQYLRIKSRSK